LLLLPSNRGRSWSSLNIFFAWHQNSRALLLLALYNSRASLRLLIGHNHSRVLLGLRDYRALLLNLRLSLMLWLGNTRLLLW